MLHFFTVIKFQALTRTNLKKEAYLTGKKRGTEDRTREGCQGLRPFRLGLATVTWPTPSVLQLTNAHHKKNTEVEMR